LSSRADLEHKCVATKSLYMSATVQNRRPQLLYSTLNTTSSHNKNVPRMNLPKFSGCFSEFKNFIGLFTSLIDSDPTLSDVKKFNHLFSCLENEALGTVKAYKMTETNYPKALAALNRVLDNQCLNFFDYISRLFDISSVRLVTAPHGTYWHSNLRILAVTR